MCYHRRRRLPEWQEQKLGIEYVGQDELFAQSDFLVNLLPYFPQTNLSLGAAQFATMRPGAFLVSCGSGGVLDEAALAQAIRSGQLGGVALDTFEWEPVKPDNPLRRLAAEDPRWNVLLTPHTAAGAGIPGVTATRGRLHVAPALSARRTGGVSPGVEVFLCRSLCPSWASR